MALGDPAEDEEGGFDLVCRIEQVEEIVGVALDPPLLVVPC